MHDYRPGQMVTTAGVYGVYFLGEYITMKALDAGEDFPAQTPGITYRLHVSF